MSIYDLSHSSLAALAACPRKYYIVKNIGNSKVYNVDLAFGSAVGAGVAAKFLGKIPILEAFLAWDCSLFEEKPKANKDFFSALSAIESFPYEDFADHEFVGAEKGHKIMLDGEFNYRGFSDLMFKDPAGVPVVVEIKTHSESQAPHPAKYGNSDQALSYAVTVFPGEEVNILWKAYSSKTQNWDTYIFPKIEQDVEDFFKSLHCATKSIEMYSALNFFPKNGASCVKFNAPCSFYGRCDNMNFPPAARDTSHYDYVLDLRTTKDVT